MIIQHCDSCGEPIANYTKLEDMMDGQDIYGWFKYFQSKHNFKNHPRWYHKLFWYVIEEFYK